MNKSPYPIRYPGSTGGNIQLNFLLSSFCHEQSKAIYFAPLCSGDIIVLLILMKTMNDKDTH